MTSKFRKPKIKRSGSKTLNELSKSMKEKGFVEVGVISPKKHTGSDLTVAEVAVFNEFGTENIPERSFMRSTLKEEKQPIIGLSKGLLKDIVKGKKDTKTGLGLIGEFTADAIKLKIVDIKTPPNAPGTIKRKGSSNPLVDTSQLKNSITYEVNDGSI